MADSDSDSDASSRTNSSLIDPLRSRLLQMPRELQLMVGDRLDDRSLMALAATCRAARTTFTRMRSGFWRIRFELKFDGRYFRVPANSSYYIVYTQRHRKSTVVRVSARLGPASWSLSPDTLIQIILECDFQGPYYVSKNLAYLKHLMASCEVMDLIGREINNHRNSPDLRFSVVQLVLLHEALDLKRPQRAYAFLEAAMCAYGNPSNRALFYIDDSGARFDVCNILGILNFVKTSISTPGHPLREAIDELAPILRPQPWHQRFPVDGNVRELGQMWRCAIGTARYHTVRRLRLPNARTPTEADTEFIGAEDDELPELFLSFDPDLLPEDEFPPHIIEHLNPYSTHPPRGRAAAGLVAGRHHAMFVGTLRVYSETHLVVGVLTRVDGRNRVEGWQRMAMLVYADPEPRTTMNSCLAGYMAASLPAGADPVDNGAAEAARYRWPAAENRPARDDHQSAQGREHQAALVEEQEQLDRESNDAARRDHRAMRTSHLLDGGEARRYFAGRPYRRPRLAEDLRGDRNIAVDDPIFAYEGLVHPGGNAVLGRWWDVEDDYNRFLNPRNSLGNPERYRQCTGPFLFWNVDLGLSYRL